MSGESAGEGQVRSERAAELFAARLARIEGGEAVELRALATEHPALADELERLCKRWEQLEAGMAQFGATEPEDPDERALLAALEASGRRPERYRLVGEIARGGMGAVVEVYDKDLERLSAKKIADLTSAVGSQGRFARLARFLREARITGRLEHPGIVPVHDLGVDEEQRPFFTMPLVRGHDLRTVFEWVHDGHADWSVARVLGVLLKVCEAIAYAHSRGVLHRDLKPANVMVGRYGEVHVMDWGLAKLTEPGERDPLTDSWTRFPAVASADGSSVDTREGDVLGTPSYMPPEQAAGRIEEVDARADVYAIGAMMYHLLAGEPPYGDTVGSSSARAVLTSVVTRPPTPLAKLAPEAPPEEVAICERAMARVPAERYASVEALGDDLRALLEGRVVTAYERGARAQLRKWVRRNRALAALFAVLAVSMPVAASLVTYIAATRDDVLAAERHARAERVEAALEEGYLELGEGDPELALASFDTALAEDSTAPEAIAGRAMALMLLERTEEALAALDARGAEEEPGLAMLRADALRALGRGDEAQVLAPTEAREPRTPLSAYLAAQGELRRGHAGDEAAFPRAVVQLERALRLSRSVRPLYAYELAHAIGHTSDDRRAFELAEMLEALWPEAPSSMHHAGSLRAGAGDLAGGRPLIERAFALRPESLVHRFGLAWAAQRAGDMETAEQVYREFLRDEPESWAANQNLAFVLRQRGEHEAAVEFARAAVRARPRNAVVHYTLAASLRSAGSPHEALPVFRESLRLDPDNRTCRRQLAETLAQLSRHADAQRELRRLLEADPDDARTWAKLGVIQLRAGEEQAVALESLRRALELDPYDTAAHVQLGLLAEARGETARAGEHYEAALVGNPRASRAHYDLGCVHLHFERNEQAVACFERALRYEPGLAHAHCNLGHALVALGRFEAALDAFRRGHELGSRDPSWKHPSEQWIREAEQWLAADRRLAEVLVAPSLASPRERAELARHALGVQRAGQAMTLIESALDEAPELADETDERWLTVGARASLAATRVQQSDAGRARGRALAWLEQELGALELALADGLLELAQVTAALDAMSADPALADVRDEAALLELPAEEATAWRFYWEAVAGLRAALAEEEQG